MIYKNYHTYTDQDICKYVCDLVTFLIHFEDLELRLITLSNLYESATQQGKDIIEIQLEVMKILCESMLKDINKILDNP